MTSIDVYGILGILHIIGFLVLLIIVKIIMDRKIPAMKLMVIYIICFAIATMLFFTMMLFTTQLKYPISSAIFIIGGITGFSFGCLLVDFIILTVVRWVYKRRFKTPL